MWNKKIIWSWSFLVIEYYQGVLIEIIIDTVFHYIGSSQQLMKP